MKEQELFDYLKANHFPDLEKSVGEYDGFDCTTASKRMFIELKSRKTHYPELLIEKIKFDFLVAEAVKLNYTPWYVNYTPEGIWAFDLSAPHMASIEWAEKWLPSTTEFVNKNNKMKMVGFISVELGRRIK